MGKWMLDAPPVAGSEEEPSDTTLIMEEPDNTQVQSRQQSVGVQCFQSKR